MNYELQPRVAHIIKRIKSTKTPTNLMFFDTETKASKIDRTTRTEYHKLWFGYFKAYKLEGTKKVRRIEGRFDNYKQFWEALLKRTELKCPLIVFAHNLAFDLTQINFWNIHEDFKVETYNYVLEDPPNFIYCRYQGKDIVFVDTFNYWKSSLADMGKSLGINKGEMPKDYKDKNAWDEYCQQDVEIISEAIYNLIKLIRTEQLGVMGFSSPAIAMSAFKSRFMKHEIFIHEDRKVCKLERDSYYGGRNECFFIGQISKSKSYYLDVNSLYPYVMSGLFPTKLTGRGKAISLFEITTRMEKYGIIAKVYISSNDETYPKRYNNRLCFCKGRFWTTLAQPELQRAIRKGHVLKIDEWSSYEMQPLFVDYVNYWWQERLKYTKEVDPVRNTFCKLMLNSLYGKFGQRAFGSTDLTLESLEWIYKQRGKPFPRHIYNKDNLVREVEANKPWFPMGLDYPLKLQNVNGHIKVIIQKDEHHESFPAIASFVTSYAREYLLSLINMAGMENTFYVDTDSLFVNDKGYRNLVKKGLINANEIGKLKLEHTTNHLQIHCPKDYVFGDMEKIKGIRRNAKQIARNTWEQLQFEGFKSIIKRGGESYISIKTITKTNSREYTKANVLSSGRVIPFTLIEDLNDPLHTVLTETKEI